MLKQQFESHKNLIISVAVIIVLGVVGFYYFNSNSSSSQPLLTDSTSTSSDSFLSTLNELQSLSLDSSIFSSPGFVLLNDNTVTLPTVSSGRQNPFAPIPGTVVLTPGTASTP